MSTIAMLYRAWILGAACAAIAGCGLSREKPTAVAPGAPQVTGTVQRAGVAVDNMQVKLYDALDGAQIDSTLTSGGGAYAFSNVSPGRWMVKVSPPDASDLGYVRFFIDIAAAGAAAAIPPFDVASHGFGLIAPADSSVAPLPNAGSPLRMDWSSYGATYLWTSARVSDSTGVEIWASNAGQTTEADWDGIGNDGSYSGQPARAGHYLWRVKIRLPNSVQAATRQRALELRSP